MQQCRGLRAIEIQCVQHHASIKRKYIHLRVTGTMRRGGTLLMMMAILAAVLATASAQDECSDRTRPAFGFFRRPASCETLKGNGECEELVREGYCLKTCGSCGGSGPAPPPPTESNEQTASTATAPPTPELDEDEKKAAAYQEKLLEQVASIEDAETSGMVEVLPTLTMNAPAPATEPAGKPAVPARKSISCKVTALDMIQKNGNLTILSQAVEALNLTKVFENPDIQYTLFAPIDSAWEAAAVAYGKTVADILEDVELLKELIFSGVISDMIVDGDAAISSQTLETQSGAVLFFKYNDAYDTEAISRFGTGTIVDTYEGCNFLIHTIDGVLAETVGVNGANPDFTEAMRG